MGQGSCLFFTWNLHKRGRVLVYKAEAVAVRRVLCRVSRSLGPFARSAPPQESDLVSMRSPSA